MTTLQKVIKYLAMAFAIFLAVSILGGIIGAVGIFAGVSSLDGTAETAETYEISQEITDLTVDIAAADFKIVSSDTLFIESNLKNLTVTERNGKLIVTETKKFGTSYNEAFLTLYIPDGFVFGEADITTGAGRLTADALSAERLHLELGAGAVHIEELNASSESEIDGGAGELIIKSGTLNNLDLDMGVGELSLTAALLGESELSCGVGETKLTLIGDKAAYRIDFDKGLGSATVDGESMSDGSVYGNGSNKIDIDSGVGAIKISFEEN